MILLDTHIWIRWLLGNGRLSAIERRELDELAAKRLLAISIISVWEAELLERKKRISTVLPFEQWISIATHSLVVAVQPLSISIILAQRDMPESLPNDPGDRIITSTAKALGIPLATHDKNILTSQAVSIWKP